MNPGRIATSLGSPRLTVLFFLAMAAAALAASQGVANITALVVVPLALLVVNLAAAILGNARFRADLPLLVFHLALLALVALLVIARLIYFEGAVRLTTGVEFDGSYHDHHQGLLHGGDAARLRFSHEGLSEHTPAGGGYPSTYANVHWLDASGMPRLAVIGNDRPLVLDGYRIFATRERGYSPLFRWQPRHGREYFGTAHLQDSFMQTGSREFIIGATLDLPGARQVWVQLVPEEPAGSTGVQHELGAESLRHHLVLRTDERRAELRPGDSIELADGRLTYLRLSTWLGYRVTYDPTAPWLVATIIVGVLSLVAFYARLWRKPRAPVALHGVAAS